VLAGGSWIAIARSGPFEALAIAVGIKSLADFSTKLMTMGILFVKPDSKNQPCAIFPTRVLDDREGAEQGHYLFIKRIAFGSNTRSFGCFWGRIEATDSHQATVILKDMIRTIPHDYRNLTSRLIEAARSGSLVEGQDFLRIPRDPERPGFDVVFLNLGRVLPTLLASKAVSDPDVELATWSILREGLFLPLKDGATLCRASPEHRRGASAYPYAACFAYHLWPSETADDPPKEAPR
jgi:hypothetical protein